ncbi:alpha/beta hydrolase [Sharpea azabuensis]|uniref:alpha/beta hydrolase n=1 Tax=Sharpea azabuensis TaxID=322505 RepID=UPI0015697833|nr:alpha/beta hydrolase [Sharpea azabuensis]
MLHEIVKIDEDAFVETYIQDRFIAHGVVKKRPALIVCPGGAYMIHAHKEAEPIAVDFLPRGFNCFVLKYTVATDRDHPEKGINPRAHYPLPALELMTTIHLVHENAEKWAVDDQNIFLIGFSAGAHVCATVGTRWNDPRLLEKLDFIPKESELKCKGMILGYPMLADNPDNFQGNEYLSISQEQKTIMNSVFYNSKNPTKEMKDNFDLRNHITMDTIPTFLWHTANDPVVDTRISSSFIEKLRAHHVNCEYHMFAKGAHGLGLANALSSRGAFEEDRSVTLWRILAQYWMEDRMKE